MYLERGYAASCGMNDAVYLPILSAGIPLQLSVLTISSSKLRAYLTRVSTPFSQASTGKLLVLLKTGMEHY